MKLTTLTLLFLLPFICLAQNEESATEMLNGLPENVNSEKYSSMKASLIGLDNKELVALGHLSATKAFSQPPAEYSNFGADAEDCNAAYIPVDPNTYTPVPRNDDGSLYIADIGFEFGICGLNYSDLFINTNGNLSFGNAVGQFSPDGFPIATPMIAPFWADVDTRNTSCGQAWYRLFPNYMIVSWENVGWYNMQCSPLNTFQVIISDGNAPIIGLGNNIQFRYGDMGWTTGTASGGGPFGGTAATVGYNSGDDVNFEQIGRFSLDNSDYDGAFGADDGVHWLDFNCFAFSASSNDITLELDCIDIVRSLDGNCSLTITPEEVGTPTTNGCSLFELDLDINTFDCTNEGANTVTVTLSNDGQSVSCTSIVTITTENCPVLSLTQVGPFCENESVVTLSSSPPGGVWGGASSDGTFDSGALGPGIHNVTYFSNNTCELITDIDIEVLPVPNVDVTPDGAGFCEEVGFVDLTAIGAGGAGSYTYDWSTPIGTDSGQAIIATDAGNYTVTVTDGVGCTDEFTTDVIVYPMPIAEIDDIGDICETDPIAFLTATPSGGTWSGAASSNGEVYPGDLGTGTHTVMYNFIGDVNGCMGEGIFEINIIDVIAIAFNDGPYCEGESIQLLAATGSGGDEASYSWTGPGGYTSFDQFPTDATMAGTYIVTVVEDGCTSEPAETIVEVTAEPIVIATNSGPYCNGNAIELFGNTGSTGTIIYSWTGPGGYLSSQQNPTDATLEGVYTLSVTGDGCPSQPQNTTVTFSPLAPPTITGDDTFCDGLSTSLNAGPGYSFYSWSNGGSSQTVTIDAAGVYTVTVSDAAGCTSEASYSVFVNQPPVPMISGLNTFCSGGSTVLDAGPDYINYVWSSSENTQEVLVSSPGTYSVTVTDSNGCTGIAQITVSESADLNPSITGSLLLCDDGGGGNTTLDAGSGFTTYSWSNGMNTQTIDVTIGGNYTVTVTDGDGCTGEAFTEVILSPPPSVAILGNTTICFGSSTLLDAGPGYTSYSWVGGSGNQILFVDNDGSYSVTVTDANGCTAEDVVDVTVSTMLLPVIAGPNSFCAGNSITIGVVDDYTSYAWSTGSADQTIDISSSGTYEVTVSDANGCTGITSIDIDENDALAPVISGPLDFCLGESTQLDAGNGFLIYSWSDGSTFQLLNATTPGSYSVTVTDAFGCTGEDEVVVVENQLPTVSVTGDTNFCENENISLDAGGPFDEYQWSDGSFGQTITVDATGTYTVTVTNGNGCTNESSINVIANPLPEPQIDGPTEFCAGTLVNLDAGNGYDTYIWSDGSITQTIDVGIGNTYTVTVTNANGCTGETQFTINENAALTPEISGLLDICEGANTTLDVGDYSIYTWNDGSLGQTIDVDESGTYSVTVTDVNGCTGETNVDVSVNNLPPVTIAGETTFCDGNNTTLDAGGPFVSYEWSDSSNGQTIDVSTSGTYSVIVVDANGCVNEASLNVIANPNPTPVIAGSTTFCAGSTATLDAGSGYTEYSWSNGSGIQTIDVNIGATYTVTVTDVNGCTGIATTTVTESTSLNPVISGELNFCAGENTLLDAGAGFETYLWSNGSVGQTLDVVAAGAYSVTVTDATGCTGETTVDIDVNNLPAVSITGNIPFCSGTEIILDAGNGFDSYEWSDLSLNQSIEIVSGGTYSVTVTDANGCTNEAQVEVIENENPTPVITGANTFCTGSMVELDAGLFDTYLWSDGSSSATIMVTTGGTYNVTVSNANGCTGETELVITENQSLEPEITGSLAYCAGENTELTATAGFNYEWSNGATTQSITVTEPGIYEVLVTDTNGCSGTTEVTVTEDEIPEPQIGGSTTFCIGTTTILDAGAGYDTYVWSDGSLNQTLEVTSEGTYTVTVTTASDCSGEANITVTQSSSLSPVIVGDLQLCEGEISMLDAGAGFDTYIWSNGEITQSIEANASGVYSVTVSDASGCTGDNSATLVISSNPTTTIAGVSNFCEGDTPTLDAGAGFNTYLWSDGSTSQTILATATDTYSVTVTNGNDCSAEASIDVVQNTTPIVDVLGPNSFCSGNTATLMTSDTYDSYEWSNGAITQSIVLTEGAILTVTVTDVNGCTGETGITVTENTSLSPVITGALDLCGGESTQLDAGSGFTTYEWTNGEDTQIITVNSGGDYGVLVTDAEGCSGTTEVSISLTENPEPMIAGSTTFCLGSSTTLDVGIFATYIWSDGSSTSTVTTNVPGNYSVTVTNAEGCIGIANVDVEESSSLNPVISGTPIFCEGANTVLDAGSGFATYLWSDGSVAQTLDVNVPGDYSVTVSDTGGCSGNTTLAISMETTPFADLLVGTNICNTLVAGSIVNLYDLVVAGDMTGDWDDADGSGALGPFDNLNFEGISAGEYNFIYSTTSAISPCEDVSYPVVITVEDCSCSGINFFNPDPICNSDGTIDLTTVVSTSEPGIWTIQALPGGANPATLTGNVFDAVGADAGEYILQYTLINSQPVGCDTEFFQSIIVDEAVSSGTSTGPSQICADDATIFVLADLVMNEDMGGSWIETSAIASQGAAFDPISGTFNTQNQMSGLYTFEYQINAALACPGQVTEIEITINELPTVIAGSGVELDCSNPILSLDATGSSSGANFEITWSGPGVIIDGNENTLTPNVESPGFYELVITNVLTGCSSSDMLEVLESIDVPVALAGVDQQITCIVSSVILQPGQAYDTDYLIEWTGPDITAANMNELNPEVQTPGTYTLTVTYIPTGCTSSSDAVEILDNTADPVIVTDLPLNGLDCNVDAIDLIGGSPNSNVTFVWTDQNGVVVGMTPVVTGINEEGIYTLTVTDTLTGCDAMETIEIVDNTSYPIADAGAPQLLNCDIVLVTLDGSGSQAGPTIVYSWTGPGIIGATTGTMIEANMPGVYTITAEDFGNGCFSESTVVVEQDIAAPNVEIASPEQLDCMIEEVSLDGSNSSSGANYIYQWQDSTGSDLGESTNIVVGDVGLYYLLVEDSNNGCIDSAFVEVTQDENIPQAAVLDIDHPDCFGEVNGIVLIEEIEGGTAPYLYSFDGSDYSGSNFYTGLAPGSYELEVEDANGCLWNTTIAINEPAALTLDLGLDLNLEWGDSVTISAGINIPVNQVDTIVWTPVDQLECMDVNCLEVGLKPSNSFAISATMTDVNGCEVRDDLLVILKKERKVYIPNAFSPNNDGFNDVFMVYANDPTVANVNFVRVFNRWGEIVFELSNLIPGIEEDGWDGRFNGEILNPAVFVYIVEVEFIDGHVELYRGDVTIMK